MNHKIRRVKGFTLTELIIVIAIIGILLGILGPTMTAYYRSSRLKTANADAKMVYNAAQTSAQRFLAEDRVRADDDKSEMGNTLVIKYTPGNPGTITFGTYAQLNKTQAVIPTPVLGTSDYDTVKAAYDALPQENKDVVDMVNYINKTVSDGSEKNWCIAIEGYMVKGAISANNEGSDLVGFYSASRTQATERSSHSYAEWIADGEGETIKGLSGVYDTATPTPLQPEAPEEPTES